MAGSLVILWTAKSKIGSALCLLPCTKRNVEPRHKQDAVVDGRLRLAVPTNLCGMAVCASKDTGQPAGTWLEHCCGECCAAYWTHQVRPRSDVASCYKHLHTSYCLETGSTQSTTAVVHHIFNDWPTLQLLLLSQGGGFFTGGGQCNVTPISRQHCIRLHQLHCHAVIYWGPNDAFCCKHHNKGSRCFSMGRTTPIIAPSHVIISTPSNAWFLGPTWLSPQMACKQRDLKRAHCQANVELEARQSPGGQTDRQIDKQTDRQCQWVANWLLTS